MPSAIDEKILSLSQSWENFKGTRVEQFLKEQLKARAGCFHYDVDNNRYIVFSDSEDRDLYLSDPIRYASLVLGSFEAPYNFEARISLSSPFFMPILKGAKGQYIDFTFDVVNKSGQSTGEEVVAVFTFRHGSVEKKVTQKYRYGASVHFCIDDYISDGANNITVAITGQASLAATSVGIVAQVIDLELSDSLQPGAFFDLRDGAQDYLEVPFSISGSGNKLIEWYIDGMKLPSVPAEDEISSVSATRTKSILISGLSHGVHSLQFRACASINGEKFYSNTLYREFAVMNSAQRTPDPIISLAAVIPSGSPVVAPGQPLSISGIRQFAPTEILFAVHNFTGAASSPAEVFLDGELIAAVDAIQDKATACLFTPNASGLHSVEIKVGDAVSSLAFSADASSMAIEEISASLALSLRALGRSNNDASRDKWSFREYSSSFSGFYWNETSGWNDSRLLVNPGASVETDFAPLAVNPTAAGFTMELEFMTRRVADDDAVVCDLTNDDGSGILITASEVRLRSAGGKQISARFKEDDNVRVAVVINRSSGSTHRGLAFIYLDGILSQAVDFQAADSFVCPKNLRFQASDDVQLSLKDIRVYRTALNPDQILNNYILYRDSASEMGYVYDRNDILFSGSEAIDPDKVAARIPVKVIKGSIPTLEATTDKKLAIVVDSQYTNLQDASLQYSMQNEQMTCQGTSSMSYPKKNFREYSNKRPDTVFINNGGEIVVERLYAFSPKSIPVDCWCDKADYAESSGSHNTGVARLWNQVMFDAQVDGAFPLRTAAQQAALDNNYPYDVRTAIDGFPIVMFYRIEDSDEPVFIGKYNFNNDKSTENVFGFRDIPGFDSSKVQCWETLNNGHHLALFQDTAGWNDEWADAFESRYPDGSTDTAALKRLADWLSTVSQEDFATQKYDYFDVPKLVAYYVYLMRFGAVDQPVKNSMLTTEDGLHWFFINYDNDTVMGLRNDGYRKYGPFITRQSLDPDFSTGVYAYAGHDSRLWNLFEADYELMHDLLPKIDDALYVAGLSYEKAIDMFDNQQAGKWCERICNRDAEYKYINPFLYNGVNNLFMLQGARSHHRRWWLSKRFNWLDGMWASGAFRANVAELKMAGAPSGIDFGVGAGVDGFFGYGVNNVRVKSGVSISRGGVHQFTTEQVLNVGDPLRIYNAVNIESLDIHNFAPYLSGLNIAGVYSTALGSKLTSLALGDAPGAVSNSALSEISGLDAAVSLQSLNIRGFRSLTSLDLSKNIYLTELLAAGSGLTAVDFAPGAPLRKIEFPDSMQAVSLVNLPTLEFSGLTLSTASLRSLEIRNCPALLNSYQFVRQWLAASSSMQGRSLVLEGVKWTDVDADEIISLFDPLKSPGCRLSVTGSIQLRSCDFSQGDKIMEVFGQHCFEEGAALRFYGPGQVYIAAPKSILSGESATIRCEMFPPVPGVTVFSIVNPQEGISISPEGVLSTNISVVNRTVTINADFTADDGTRYPRKQTSIEVRAVTDIASVDLHCPILIDECVARVTVSPESSQVAFSTKWSIEQGAYYDAVKIVESDNSSCRLRNISGSYDTSIVSTLRAEITTAFGDKFIKTAKVMLASPDFMQKCVVLEAEGVVNVTCSCSDTSRSDAFSGIGFSEGSLFATASHHRNSHNSFITPHLPKGSRLYIYGMDFLNALQIDGMGVSGVLDLQQYPQFTAVRVQDTSISEVRLPDNSPVSTLLLPNSLTALWIRNFRSLDLADRKSFCLESPANVRELILIRDGMVDVSKIVDFVKNSGGPQGFRLHVNAFGKRAYSIDNLAYLALCSGVGADGYPEDRPTFVAYAYIEFLNRWEDLDLMKSRFVGFLPELSNGLSVASADKNGNMRFLAISVFHGVDSCEGVPSFFIGLKDGKSVSVNWGDGSPAEVISESGIVSHEYANSDENSLHPEYHMIDISGSENISRIVLYPKDSPHDRNWLHSFFYLGASGIFPELVEDGVSVKHFYLLRLPDEFFLHAPDGYSLDDALDTTSFKFEMAANSRFDPAPVVSDGVFDYLFEDMSLREIPSWIMESFKKSPRFTRAGVIFKGVSGIDDIPKGLFDGCVNVTNFDQVFQESSVRSMPEGLFANCSKVKSYCQAFMDCDFLVVKRFPENFAPECSFSKIFNGCPVGSMIVTQTVPPALRSSADIVAGDKIYVPDQSVDDYKAATFWLDHADDILPMSQLPDSLK